MDTLSSRAGTEALSSQSPDHISAWCTDEHLLECSTTFPRTETSGPHRWCRGN